MSEKNAAMDGSENEDVLTTPEEVKRVVQELLRVGFVDADEQQALYDAVKRWHERIAVVLEPLDLAVQVDEVRGVAVLRVRVVDIVGDDAVVDAGDEELDAAWSHALVRRQRLTLEQSLMVALLRRHFVVREQERGLGVEKVRVAVDELVEEMKVFLGDSGSDQQNERRVLTLLEKLRLHGVVSEVDTNQEVVVRPLIVYLADPASLKGLLEQMKNLVERAGDD